jgi:predicted metal-binding membrane protein
MRENFEVDHTWAASGLREAVPPWATLAAVGGLAWVVTVGRAGEMGARPGTMGMAFLLFVGMWVTMMAAMMLPAIGPMAAVETLRAPRGTASLIPGALTFAGGFLVPWAGYGALTFAALTGTGRLVEASPGAARWLGVGIFAIAGLYQFSPWKMRALAHCRTPMHSASGRGFIGDVSSGIRDGGFCIGCCWALMTVLLAVGVMNVRAMAGLAAVIFAEKVLPRPRLVAGLAGATLLALALVAAFVPSLLPGLTAADMGMRMEPGGM